MFEVNDDKRSGLTGARMKPDWVAAKESRITKTRS